jgi:hypothetical protein
MTHIKKVLKNMLGSNILKFLTPLLEDKVEMMTTSLNENFWYVVVKAPNLVVSEHT